MCPKILSLFFFRKAQNLLNNLKKLTLDRAHVDDLKKRLGVLENLLRDLINKIDEKVRKPVERSNETYRIGSARKEAVLVSNLFIIKNHIHQFQ